MHHDNPRWLLPPAAQNLTHAREAKLRPADNGCGRGHARDVAGELKGGVALAEDEDVLVAVELAVQRNSLVAVNQRPGLVAMAHVGRNLGGRQTSRHHHHAAPELLLCGRSGAGGPAAAPATVSAAATTTCQPCTTHDPASVVVVGLAVTTCHCTQRRSNWHRVIVQQLTSVHSCDIKLLIVVVVGVSSSNSSSGGSSGSVHWFCLPPFRTHDVSRSTRSALCNLHGCACAVRIRYLRANRPVVNVTSTAAAAVVTCVASRLWVWECRRSVHNTQARHQLAVTGRRWHQCVYAELNSLLQLDAATRAQPRFKCYLSCARVV